MAKIQITSKGNPLNGQPKVMGILNVTPDSFSDGGLFVEKDRAVAKGLEMVAAGADIIDVGGESTQPGSDAVSADEEMARLIPVIEALAGKTDALISVDTVKPVVAEAALQAGAQMLNDVSGLRDGVTMAELACKTGATLVLMHSRGTPKTMGSLAEYRNVVSEVKEELLQSVDRALAVGVQKAQIWLDPGIGFAKRAKESLTLLSKLEALVGIGYPVLVGPSRKSFIGEVMPSDVSERLGGTAAAVTVSILKGAYAVRVHDISEMRQAALVAHALRLRDEVMLV